MIKQELKEAFANECTTTDSKGRTVVKGTPMDIIIWIDNYIKSLPQPLSNLNNNRPYLKVFFDWFLNWEKSNDGWELTFDKLCDVFENSEDYKTFSKHSPLPTDSNESVKFAEWMTKYELIYSLGLQKGAWINTSEHDVYINGSEIHYRELIEKYGKTTQELYTLYKEGEKK